MESFTFCIKEIPHFPQGYGRYEFFTNEYEQTMDRIIVEMSKRSDKKYISHISFATEEPTGGFVETKTLLGDHSSQIPEVIKRYLIKVYIEDR